MITAREVSYGLFGAWRLAHLDPRGMQYLDTSVEGFWRSFWAAAIAAPLYSVIVMLKFARQDLEFDALRFLLIETIGYSIVWTAYPLAAWYLVAALDRSSRYTGYIVAVNWANVVQIALTLPVFALVASGALPTPLSAVLRIAVLAAVLYYHYFIVRTALEVDAPAAVGLVFTDFAISFLREMVVLTLEFPRGVAPEPI
jgi:hypothetical protein